MSDAEKRYLAETMYSETDLLNLTETAEMLNVNPGQIVEWMSKERLPVVRLGRGTATVLRFQRGQVLSWAKNRAEVSSEVARTLSQSGFWKKLPQP